MKGFTLVEIMIVFSIIGLLAAIAIPNIMQVDATAVISFIGTLLIVLEWVVGIALSYDLTEQD